ncbi:ABC transporter ATP-binding protein [Nonomuraea sp. NPDC048882]|uniref:ABC transporter ATP-binding protein n=1 Tax=unclassified Nonomuraea TaxID=2593643 RepID=UPI0033F17BF4
MPVIETVDLTKRYREVVAADGVCLRVAPGDVHALVGLNGAGKTTLIRMLLGMIAPTSGTARVLGAEVSAGDRGAWARTGYLIDTPAAYPELTVRENLRLVARLRRLPRPAGRVDDVIDRLALTPYAGRRARTLSMGNAQRLALAKALIHSPDLLILDEPSNGLDPAGVVEIRTLLSELAREHGTTVLLSSHLLAEVTRLATRIAVIHQGRLLQEINPRQLGGQVRRRLVLATRDDTRAAHALAGYGFTSEPGVGAGLVLTGQRALEHPEEIATALVEAGCPPTRLVVEQEDLEDFFLRLVGEADA